MNSKEFQAPWFNQCAWIFEHLDQFSLTPQQALLVLIIAHLNSTQQPVSYERLMEMSHMKEEELDQALDELGTKGYVMVARKGDGLDFLLDRLFSAPVSRNLDFALPVLDEFEIEFKRPLTSNEMERISMMVDLYGERPVIYALDEAVVYEKVNLNYIENILLSWKNKGLSEQDLREGKR